MSLAWHMKALIAEKVAERDRNPHKWFIMPQTGDRTSMALAIVEFEQDNPGDRIVKAEELRGEVYRKRKS